MLYILEAQIENFKRIKVLNLKFDGKFFQVTGKNASGKSSTLDALIGAIAGKRLIDGEPLHKGETKGKITLKLGNGKTAEYTTELSITEKGTYLTLKGNYPGTPQAFLDSLVSGLTFDPMQFAKMDAKKQAEMIIDFAGARDKLTQHNNAIEKLKLARRDNDRDMKAEKARLTPLIEILSDNSVPATEIDTVELHNQIAEKERTLKDNESKRQLAESLRDTIAELEAKIESKKAELERVKFDLTQVDAAAVSAARNSLLETFKNSTAINQRIREKARAKEIADSYKKLLQQSQFLNGEIQDCEDAKTDLLKGIKMPVTGMSIDDERGLLYNDIPFDQLATSEKIKIACALGMLLNPELKIIIIRDGNDLDDEGVKKICKFAEATGYQVIMERIYKAKEVGIVFEIENGELKNTIV